MSVEIEIAKEEDREEWDKLVEASPHSTIFHTWKWLKIMEKYSWMKTVMKKRVKCKLYPVIGLKGETPIGVFPLFLYNSSLFRMVASPPSKVEVDYLGPLIVNYDKLKQNKRESLFMEFQNAVDEFIVSELKADCISVKTPPEMIDCRPFLWSGYDVKPRFNYIIDLGRGIDYLWKQFKGGLRKKINTAEEKGVSVEEGSKKDLEYIYKYYYETFESQGLSINFSKEYLFDVYDAFYPHNLKVFVARYQGEFASGMIATCFRNIFSDWRGSVFPDLKTIPSNDLLHWETMKWAINNGFKYYEITWANTPRLNPFKSKYNPDLSIYFSATKHTSFLSKLIDVGYTRILKSMSMGRKGNINKRNKG